MAAVLPRRFGNNVPRNTTRAPAVGFELTTNGIQFYAIQWQPLPSYLSKLAMATGTRWSPVAIGTRGTGQEYLFVILLVARANNIQMFRCKASPLRPRKRLQRCISRTFYASYGGAARGQAGRASCDVQFEPYRWRPFGVTWDSSVVIKLWPALPVIGSRLCIMPVTVIVCSE